MSEQMTALVTGANKGIGYEIAAGLGALGWKVGVGARDEQRLGAAVQQLQAAGVDAFAVPLDVTDDASAANAAAFIEEHTGRLDALVNNAGITGGGPQTPTTVTPEIMRAVVETNVIGVIRVTNATLAPLGLAADRERLKQRRLAHAADHRRRSRAHRGRLRAVEVVPQRRHHPVRQGA